MSNLLLEVNISYCLLCVFLQESGRVPQGMLRLPIGIVICPPGKSSPEATAGIDGRSKSRSNISRRGYDTQWSENSAASITIDKPENILLPYKPADNT